MKRRRIIIGSIFFVCIVVSVHILINIFVHSPAPNIISNVKGLKLYKRKWIKRTFVPIHMNKDISNPAFLSYPYFLKYYGNNLYIADDSGGTFQIRRFSKNGKFLNSIGNGTGRGPGQFEHIVDYFVKDSTIWVVDGNQLFLSKFTITGKYKNGFPLKNISDRIVGYGNNKIALQVFGGSKLFCSYDTSGNLLDRFGVLASSQLENPLSFSGWLLPAPHNGFLFVTIKASLIYFFSARDSIRKIVTTPDGESFPATINKSTNDRRQLVAPFPKVETINADNNHGILYLYMLIKKKSGRLGPGQLKFQKGVLDCYNWKTGRYLDSIRLPFVPDCIEVAGDTLYCLFQNTGKIKAYKMVKG